MTVNHTHGEMGLYPSQSGVGLTTSAAGDWRLSISTRGEAGSYPSQSGVGLTTSSAGYGFLILIWFNGTSAHMGHFSAKMVAGYGQTSISMHG